MLGAGVGPDDGVDRYMSRVLIYWGLATLTISVGGLLLLGMGRRRW